MQHDVTVILTDSFPSLRLKALKLSNLPCVLFGVKLQEENVDRQSPTFCKNPHPMQEGTLHLKGRVSPRSRSPRDQPWQRQQREERRGREEMDGLGATFAATSGCDGKKDARKGVRARSVGRTLGILAVLWYWQQNLTLQGGWHWPLCILDFFTTRKTFDPFLMFGCGVRSDAGSLVLGPTMI